MTTYSKQQGITMGEGMYGILQSLGSDEEIDTGTNSELSDDGYVENVSDADVSTITYTYTNGLALSKWLNPIPSSLQ